MPIRTKEPDCNMSDIKGHLLSSTETHAYITDMVDQMRKLARAAHLHHLEGLLDITHKAAVNEFYREFVTITDKAVGSLE